MDRGPLSSSHRASAPELQVSPSGREIAVSSTISPGPRSSLMDSKTAAKLRRQSRVSQRASAVVPGSSQRASTLRRSVRDALRNRSNSIEHVMFEVRSAFDPNSSLIHLWQQMLLGCLLYEVMVLPYLVIFKPDYEHWLTTELMIVYGCEILFLCDIYVELNTGYYEDGNVNLDAKLSRAKYLKSARFVLDVLALPPWSLLLRPLNLSIHPVFLEFHKILRVWRAPRYVAVLDDIYARHFELLKMFKVLLVTVLTSHFVACFRFLFGYDDEHHHNHWLPKHRVTEQPAQSKYVMSVFWAFGLLTGLFEGELPYSIVEFAFTIFVALCGISLFTYLCATFFMISKCESGHLEAAEGRINQLKHLLSFHHVPESLQIQAIGYLKRFYTQSESNDREAMRILCPSIAKDIQVALLKEMVGNILFFQGCNDQFIIAITSLLELISLPANVVVFNAGDEGDAMYVVNSGVLHVVVNGIKIREVRKGAFFGEMALFLRRPRYATVMTSTYCTLYKLVRFHVERLLEGYPQYAQSIPKRVAEMARTLFGRVSGEVLILPDETIVNEAVAKPEEKKTFRNLLRKHMKKDKNKVSPADLSSQAIARLLSPTGSLIPDGEQRKSESKVSTGHELGKNGDDSELRPSMLSVTKRQPSERMLGPKGKVTRVMQEFYSQNAWTQTKTKQRYWWSSILLSTAIDGETNRRVWWIVLLGLVLIYNWTTIPLQLSFRVLRRNTWYITAINTVTDIVLFIDMYLNFNMAYIQDSEKIWDTTKTALRYFRSRFAFDLLCAFPYWLFAPFAHHAVPRIPRLLRVFGISGHFKEVDDVLHITSKQRLLLFGVLLIMLYHIVACLHFSITYLEGFSPKHDAWIPSDDIFLHEVNETHFMDVHNETYRFDDPRVIHVGQMQYFRSLYYAANVLTALGRTMEPDSDTQYGIALIFMLSGFFITAIVVDNVQKRFTASAVDQKEFYTTRAHIQLFLRRQRAPLSVHKRVNAFLDYWWSSHRGAVISELLEELPETIKRDIIHSICQPALQTLALLNGVRPVLSGLETVFLDNVKFILYGQGEIVYRQGDFASGLFFLLEGNVMMTTNGGQPRMIPQGGFFGTASLHLEGNAVSYTERVTATSGCIVLYVSREQIHALNRAFHSFDESMRALERRFLDPKLAKASEMHSGGSRGPKADRFRWSICNDDDRVFDPDSIYMLAWETWLFIAMTAQWVMVIFHICFGVSEGETVKADGILVFIELSFLVDIYVRSHLGYYEFGNKVMLAKRIRKRYFRSSEFLIDLFALLPFFAINWAVIHTKRLETLNFNKLARLMKVPTQFTALENKYLKRTLELRLFKLVYYTFLLSHMFGSIWFDFGSNASGFHSLQSSDGTASSGFGITLWAPTTDMEHKPLSYQYFASLFWSFGLMSASSPGELPKLVTQCIFSVITMTCGFFLFAYVIGNFSDTIEMMDAENREFYTKLNGLRHLLAHFQLPQSIAEKFKNYFFFKRFHSITQEHLLERCLPPSLLTDIRMVHLQPMIVKVKFLSGMDASVTRMLVSQFSQVLKVKDEFVYRLGEEGSDMFFVFTGLLDTLLPHEEYLKDSQIERKSSNAAFQLGFGPDRARSTSSSAMTGQPLLARPSIRKLPTHKSLPQNRLTKLNEITAGSYFGENALFFNSVRTSYVQAKTSCILYRLSRQSLELVFDRYPAWKEKVLRIMTIQQEQNRLNRLAFEVEKFAEIDKIFGQTDEMNDRAEQTEEEFLFRRAKSVAAKRKGSQSSRLLIANGMERAQESGPPAPTRAPQWIREFTHGTHAQSVYHLFWLKLMVATTIYVAIVVPYRIAFDTLQRQGTTPALFREWELVCEVLFLWDIWFNWKLRGSRDSMELYEQDHRDAYRKERLFWDVAAAFPLDYLLSSMYPRPWHRINRCIKMRNLMHYMNEINRRSIYNEMHRLRTTCLMYILVIYWSACAYFVIATHEGFGDEWQAWRPDESLKITNPDAPSSNQVTLRLLRGLFFATTAFVKKGRTFIPDSTVHYGFAIVTCFVGLMCMAFMIGEIASLFISYIGNEVEYRKNHIAVELYLGRWKIQRELKARTQAFLSSLWSSHRGVDYQKFLEEVPLSIRMESVLNIANWPLKIFTDDIVRSICPGDQNTNVELLMQLLAQTLRFEGYPRDERVVVEGSISKAMYFVVRGRLHAVSRSQAMMYNNMRFVKGDYFGERGLLGFSVSAFSVRTLRACDLLSLSAEDLLSVLHSHPTYNIALDIADRASRAMKCMHVLDTLVGMEERWGQQLALALKQLRQECDCNDGDPTLLYARKKTRSIMDRSFPLLPSADLYLAFRPFLQILVPNGVLHLHGLPRGRKIGTPQDERDNTDPSPQATSTAPTESLTSQGQSTAAMLERPPSSLSVASGLSIARKLSEGIASVLSNGAERQPSSRQMSGRLASRKSTADTATVAHGGSPESSAPNTRPPSRFQEHEEAIADLMRRHSASMIIQSTEDVMSTVRATGSLSPSGSVADLAGETRITRRRMSGPTLMVTELMPAVEEAPASRRQTRSSLSHRNST